MEQNKQLEIISLFQKLGDEIIPGGALLYKQ